MTIRDPFPMSSVEAEKLAGSVGGNDNAANSLWQEMDTQTAGTQPVDGAAAVDGADGRKGLTKPSNSKQQRNSKKQKNKKQGDFEGVDSVDEVGGYDKDDQDDDQDDDFLDRPVWESRERGVGRWRVKCLRFLEKVYHRLYGDNLPISEMVRTLCLASTLFFMIGGYWLLRSLKDPILTALCGVSVIPKAKIMSVFVVLAVVSIYNHFLDSDIPRHKLFYVFGTFYFALFICIALALMHPTYGLENQQQSPYRLLGWISYCSIESFGSVMVSLFWSFANSNFTLETAKASYGVMVATAQVGSIIGPTIVNRYAEQWGPAKCYMMGAFCMSLLQVTMALYIHIYGVEERNQVPGAAVAAPKKKSKAGVTEGLKLFWRYRYVKGIFAISCLFMVEVTIVDFTMKVLARDYFASLHPCEPDMSCWNDDDPTDHGMSSDATAAFTTFMGFFGQATNTLSFLFSLFGTSAVIRTLGFRLSLLLFPTLCLGVIIMVRIRPTLYVVFGAMMLLKGFSYAFNNPTKEMLYQPTSSAVRYKAKSWIDIFGARGSKAMGSLVNNAFSDSASRLVSNGSLVGMAVATFLIFNAIAMGKIFEEYTSTGHVVGEDWEDDLPVDADKNIEMASKQNETSDTSCAIYDDHETGAAEEGQELDNDGDDNDDDDEQEEQPKAKVTMV